MTYGEKIEQMIDTINGLYADAEWMRDYGDLSEKDHWNKFRGHFYIADAPLRKLLEKVAITGRYGMKLDEKCK